MQLQGGGGPVEQFPVASVLCRISIHVSQPSQATQTEQELYAKETCSLKYCRVRYFALLIDCYDTPKATKVETLQTMLLSSVGIPGITPTKHDD